MIGFYQIQTINCKIYLPFAANVQQRVSIHASNCLISVVCRVSLSNWVKKFKHVCSKVSLESSSTRACGWCDKPTSFWTWKCRQLAIIAVKPDYIGQLRESFCTALWEVELPQNYIKLHSGYRSPQPRGETPSLWKEWQNFPNHFRALTLAEAGFYMLSFHVQTCKSQLCG